MQFALTFFFQAAFPPGTTSHNLLMASLCLHTHTKSKSTIRGFTTSHTQKTHKKHFPSVSVQPPSVSVQPLCENKACV